MSKQVIQGPLVSFLIAGLVLQTVGISALAQTAAPAQKPAAQTAAPAQKAPAKAAPARAASQVDSVIQLVKSGMSESLIIRTLKKQNKPVDLSPADLVKLQTAGVSENVIGVMMDPTSTPAAAATPAPAAAPAPAPAPAALAPAVTSTTAGAAAPATVSTVVNQAMKKRVIVDDFDYSTVTTAVQSVFGTTQNIGKGIRAMLIDRLTKQGHVVIVERAKIDQLMKEQDRDAGNRVKQGTGARVGRISGADALLTGDITTFGRDDKKKNVSAGAFGGVWGRAAAGAFNSSHSDDKAVVAITYRLVDAETSEVIASGEARGESSRKSKGFGGMLAGFAGGAMGAGAAQVDMTSSNFAETIIGEATQDCVNKLSEIMNTQSDSMKKTVRAVEASVADISGQVLTITAGSNDGVYQGDVFDILRVTREVKDPTTHEILDRLTEKVGELTITTVRDKIATGNYQGAAVQLAYVARKRT